MINKPSWCGNNHFDAWSKLRSLVQKKDESSTLRNLLSSRTISNKIIIHRSMLHFFKQTGDCCRPVLRCWYLRQQWQFGSHLQSGWTPSPVKSMDQGPVKCCWIVHWKHVYADQTLYMPRVMVKVTVSNVQSRWSQGETQCKEILVSSPMIR